MSKTEEKIEWREKGSGGFNEAFFTEEKGHRLVKGSEYEGAWVFKRQLKLKQERSDPDRSILISIQPLKTGPADGRLDLHFVIDGASPKVVSSYKSYTDLPLEPRQIAELKQIFETYRLIWPPTEDISIDDARIHNAIICTITNRAHTDSVSRSLRLFKEINEENYPVGEYKDGWVAPYFRENADNDCQIAAKILDIYQKFRRIVLDGIDFRNFKVDNEDKLVLVDVSMALRRGSVISDQHGRAWANGYLEYWWGDKWVVKESLHMIRALLYLEKYLQPEEIKDEYLQDVILWGFTDKFRENKLTKDFMDLLIKIQRFIRWFDFADNMQEIYDNQALLNTIVTTVGGMESKEPSDKFKRFEKINSLISSGAESKINHQVIFSNPSFQELICSVCWIDDSKYEGIVRDAGPAIEHSRPMKAIFNLWKINLFPATKDIYQKIFASVILQNALLQACDYLKSNQFGFFSSHGLTGKSQTDTFIKHLLLGDASESVVRQETQNWIKGYGWAGGSSLKLGSRTHFAYDYGIFGYSASRQSWAELSEAEKEHARELMLKKS